MIERADELPPGFRTREMRTTQLGSPCYPYPVAAIKKIPAFSVGELVPEKALESVVLA
jgi:hypothetical protein